MPILFKYFVLRRTTRGTSGHEDEELGAALNEHARAGWRLRQIIESVPRQQTIIFEREVECEKK